MMRTALRPFFALCFFALCLLHLSVRADFAVEYHFTDFTQQPQPSRPVYITPLWTVNAAGTNFLTPDRARYTSDASASLIVSNFSSLVSAAYRVEFYGRFSIMQFTNYFPTNLTGLVNAKDYVTLPTGLPSAYSTTDSDARYVIRAGDTAYNLAFLKPNGLSSTNTGTVGQVFKWLTSATGYWATLQGTDGIASNNGSGRYNLLTNPVVRFIGPGQTTTLTTNGNRFEVQTDGASDYTPLSFDFGQQAATLSGFDLTVGTLADEGSIRNFNNSGGLDYSGLYGLASRLTNGAPTLATNHATATDGMSLVKRGNNLNLETVSGASNPTFGDQFNSAGGLTNIAANAGFTNPVMRFIGPSQTLTIKTNGDTVEFLATGASSYTPMIWDFANQSATYEDFILSVAGNAAIRGASVDSGIDGSGLYGSGANLTSIPAGQLTGNLSVNRFNGAAAADNTTFWRGDGVWAVPAGGGGGGSGGSHPIPTNNVDWLGYNLTNLQSLQMNGALTNNTGFYGNVGNTTNYYATNLIGILLSNSLPTSGVGVGTYGTVTVDNKGRVMSGSDNATALTNASPGLATNASVALDGMSLVKRGNHLKLEVASPTNAWLLTGNSGNSSNQFIGNSDAVPLTLKVNGGASAFFDLRSSAVFGSYSNYIYGWSPHSTIAGGSNNIINETFDAIFFGSQGFNFIGGGRDNYIYGTENASETIGGGHGNQIIDGNSEGANVIAGGVANLIRTNSGSTIGGGANNTIEGPLHNWATIPGGWGNRAKGDYTFAAGRSANAEHIGAFVWADSLGPQFSSTASNTFNVRASGGFFLNGAPVTAGSNIVSTAGFSDTATASNNFAGLVSLAGRTVFNGSRQVYMVINQPGLPWAYEQSSLSTNANFLANYIGAPSSNQHLIITYTNTGPWITGTLSQAASWLDANGASGSLFRLPPTNITQIHFSTDANTNLLARYLTTMPNTTLDSIVSSGGTATAGQLLISDGAGSYTNGTIGAGAGTVTSVTGDTNFSIATPTSTPVISFTNYNGTGPFARVTGPTFSNPTFTGLLTGSGQALTNVSHAAPTNAWTANTPLILGTTNYYATSGTATIGITGVQNVPVSGTDYTELTLLSTGTITFTNVAGIKFNDGLTSRTITNGNSAVLAVTVMAGRVTNAAIVQFW